MQPRAPTPPEQERGPFAGALPGLLLSAGFGLAIALLPLLAGPGKYFTDDMESQFVPTLYAIGATLRAEGAVPLLTAQSWYGGNLAAEFQYGLFNPVLLLVYALLPGFATLTGAAACLGAVFTAILGAGGFLLARALRIAPPLCHAAGFAAAANTFLYAWYATSWLPAFTSIAFMLWAMAFLLRAHRGAGGFLAAGAGVYLTVTAGWPQTVLVLGLFVGCRCGALALAGRWRDAAWPALAAALGVGAAAVALLPLLGMAEVAERHSGIVTGGFLVPDLGDVLAVSQPLHLGYVLHFDGYSALPAPMFHAAWFVLPVACLLAWARVPWRDPTLRALLGFVLLTLLATQGPSQIGPLRWPVRFLPYFQIGLVLLTLLAVTRAGFAPLDATRRRLLLGAILVSTLLAWQSVPAPLFVALLSGLLLGLATLALLAAGLRDLPALGRILAGFTALIALVTRLMLPDGVLPARGSPAVPGELRPLSELPSRYALHAGRLPAPAETEGHFDHLLWGQMGLARGEALVNGYSPIGHRGLAARLCLQTHGTTCAAAAARLLEADPETGASFADLMRVDRIVVERGPHLDALPALPPPGWRIAAEAPRSVVLARSLPDAGLPGSVAWTSPGVRVAAEAPATATREALDVAAGVPGGAGIVFARAAWPGYRATLDGVPVMLRAHAGFLLAADLPPGARGRLVLEFRPPGFATGRAVSAASVSLLLLLGLAQALGAARRRRGGAPAGRATGP